MPLKPKQAGSRAERLKLHRLIILREFAKATSKLLRHAYNVAVLHERNSMCARE